jgi:hypothetical protein
MADLTPLTAKDHRTIVVDTIEVVEKIERIHQRKHLTILHNKEQNHGVLKTNG